MEKEEFKVKKNFFIRSIIIMPVAIIISEFLGDMIEGEGFLEKSIIFGIFFYLFYYIWNKVEYLMKKDELKRWKLEKKIDQMNQERQTKRNEKN